jgi:hypothetical protein
MMMRKPCSDGRPGDLSYPLAMPMQYPHPLPPPPNHPALSGCERTTLSLGRVSIGGWVRITAAVTAALCVGPGRRLRCGLLGDQVLPLRLIGKVDPGRRGLSAGCADVGCNPLGIPPQDVGDNHLGAFGREQLNYK